MDPITQQAVLATAGAAGGDKVYVDDVFSTFLYEGSSSAQTITNGIDLSTEGGLVWMKSRTNTNNHALVDSERSWTGWLQSNSTNASQGGGTYISANTDGFTFNIANLFFNVDPQDYTSWTFRKAPGFFDIVTYAGNSTAGRTIAHNLGSVPGMIIIKAFSGTVPAQQWFVYHRSVGAGKYLRLNQTSSASTTITFMNDTEPTSSVFSLGNSNSTNGTGINYVAYVFAHDEPVFGTNSDESIIKCGSYTGNGSTTGPVIDLGFEPQWLMIKRRDSTSGWAMYDMMRGAGVPNQTIFEANNNGVEGSYSTFALDFQPTGFQIKASSAFTINANGGNYIYMAIRRPHKPPEAGTDVFAAATQTGKSGNQGAFRSGFVVDMAIRLSSIQAASQRFLSSRMTAPKYLLTNSTAAEDTDSDNKYDFMDGWNNETISSTSKFSWMFKRAPGFFDVVAYSAASGDLTVPHSLGVTPEMIIIKSRNHTSSWKVWHSGLSAGTASTNYNCNLDDDAAEVGPNANIVSYSNTNFIVGNGRTATNKSSVNGTYIAYLFATLPAISKVGSYTGSSSAVNVDCGFSSGARFILIKRTDASGDWFVYDTTRGIISGNDPYLFFNDTASEVTNTDYIDPLNSGFTVTSSAPADLNTSGGTYIFLAIA